MYTAFLNGGNSIQFEDKSELEDLTYEQANLIHFYDKTELCQNKVYWNSQYKCWEVNTKQGKMFYSKFFAQWRPLQETNIATFAPIDSLPQQP